jgi:hypothetical protein
MVAKYNHTTAKFIKQRLTTQKSDFVGNIDCDISNKKDIVAIANTRNEY